MIDPFDLTIEPDLVSGEVEVFIGHPSTYPVITTPGRCVTFNTTEDWKKAVRYIVRYWDMCEEAEARGES